MQSGTGARILVLGAGFGGLELATELSEALGESAEVTVIDRSDAFVFGTRSST
jgi:sulfide:quinone oxidoreductase